MLPEGLRRPVGEGAEAVQAGRAIGFDGGRAEEFGELAGALAAQEIHLEEALLGVDETESAGDVRTVLPTDRRHPESVALDGDCGAQTGNRRFAFELGEAPSDQAPDPQTGRKNEQQRRNHDDPENLDPTTHANLLRTGNTLAKERRS